MNTSLKTLTLRALRQSIHGIPMTSQLARLRVIRVHRKTNSTALMVDSDEEGRTETWEVGRLKSVKEVNINLPQGGTTVVALIFVWQALDAAGRMTLTGSILTDLSLDVAGCGTTGEWVMIEPKLIGLNSGRGRGGRARGRGSGRRGRGRPGI